MTSDHAALSAFLGRAYAAQMLQREPMATVVTEFRAAAADDPTLITAAQAEAARLKPIEDRRCVISKTAKAFLRDALAP